MLSMRNQNLGARLPRTGTQWHSTKGGHRMIARLLKQTLIGIGVMGALENRAAVWLRAACAPPAIIQSNSAQLRSASLALDTIPDSS